MQNTIGNKIFSEFFDSTAFVAAVYPRPLVDKQMSCLRHGFLRLINVKQTYVGDDALSHTGPPSTAQVTKISYFAQLVYPNNSFRVWANPVVQ